MEIVKISAAAKLLGGGGVGWEEGGMNRAERIFRAVVLWYDIIMMNHTLVQIHRMYNSQSEPYGKCGLWVITVCHVGSWTIITGGTTRVADADEGGGRCMCKQEVDGNSSAPSVQFHCEPQTALKN